MSLKQLKIGLLVVANSAIAWCSGAVLPRPAQVLDRYLQATGGSPAWHSKKSERVEIEGRDLESSRTILKASLTTARNGNSIHQIQNPQEASEGVFNGVAWAWTKLAGPRIKHGEERTQAIRSSRMLEEADWKSLYPKSTVDGAEHVNGKFCYRVSFLPSAERRMEWFDIETGLLVRRSYIEPTGDGEIAVSQTVEAWTWNDGLMQPSSMLVERGDQLYRVLVLATTYNENTKADSYRLPQAVETYLASERAGKALPSADEIIERHIFASGGAAAFETLKSQRISGNLDYLASGMRAHTETWSTTGGRYYQSVELPGLGKQEEGSDGSIAWERSPTLGPRAKPKSTLSGLGVTIDAAEVAAWRLLVSEVRTEALEKIDGRECHRVRIVARDGKQISTRWYQKSNGLLYRTSMPLATAMGSIPAVLTYEAYREVAGIKWPVVIRVAASGQELLFRADEVALNDPIDKTVFELPEEIRRLAANRTSGEETSTP